MEIPHQTFFIEASPDMPNILKERVVDAVSRIHRQGVLLGNINLRNFLICPDGRVVVTNFEYCKSSSPNKALKIDLASAADLRLEMRKLKVRLDYGTAREDEHKRFEAQHRRYHANFLHMQESAFRGERGVNLETETMEDTTDPPIHLETSDWFPRAQERPRRFVIPGVNADTFRKARQAFLLLAPEDSGLSTVPKPEDSEEGVDALNPPPQPTTRIYKHHDKTASESISLKPSVRLLTFTSTMHGRIANHPCRHPIQQHHPNSTQDCCARLWQTENAIIRHSWQAEKRIRCYRTVSKTTEDTHGMVMALVQPLFACASFPQPFLLHKTTS